MSHVTTDSDVFPLTRLSFDLGVEDVNVLGADLWKEGNWIVYLNGLVLGVHASPTTFVAAMRRLRRRGKVSEFVSVYASPPPSNKTVFLY